MLAFLFWIVAAPVLVIVVCVAWLWLMSRLVRCLLGE
ncbi:MAG: hypothetical protein K0S79_176 [Nitrospira sp.]|jgi:hypothetical protein|nr:hypothetical protein [Nitrospira sp.]